MPEGQVLEFNRVTKRFGAVTAVADLSVRVEPGVVTGFLGPNGAGKTTSLRMMLGQIRPTSGSVTIGGVPYSDLRNPLRSVGAVLEEAAYRPRRTASRQLMISAKANGIPSTRIGEVLRLVGLQDDADTRLGSYSLGMRQRLAVASALLGDPGVLVLDEPANGLDPEGIRWMRLLMRRLADEGRTVLVSSHVLSEIEQVADSVVVLSKGRAVFSGPIDQLADPDGGAVIVDAANRAQLITALSAAKLNFDVLRSGVTVRDSDAATVGAITTAASVPLTLLQQRGPSLEDVFLDLVYGRRSDSPRLDEVANPIAHAAQEGATPASAEAAAPEDAPEADAPLTDVPEPGAAPADSAAAGVAAAGVAATVATDATDTEGDHGTPPVETPTDAESAGAASEAADQEEADAEGAEPETAEEASDVAATADAATPGDAEDAAAAAEDGEGHAVDTDIPAALESGDETEPGFRSASGDDTESPDDTEPGDTEPGPADEGAIRTEADDDTATDTSTDTDTGTDTTIGADAASGSAGEPNGEDEPSAPEPRAGVEHPRRADRRSLRGAAFGLWDTRPAPTAPAAAASDADADAAETGAAEDAGGPVTAPTAPDAPETEDEHVDQDQPLSREHADDRADEADIVLPLATEAVSIPAATDATTFTELITGIPASAAPDTAEPTSPATEAISVFAPLLSDDDDDDSAVDDAEDDPRLAAMRTSLSSAASRFFGGPAPDYPYGTVPVQGTAPVQDASPARDEQSTPTAEVTPEDGSNGSEESATGSEDAEQQPDPQSGDENRD